MADEGQILLEARLKDYVSGELDKINKNIGGFKSTVVKNNNDIDASTEKSASFFEKKWEASFSKGIGKLIKTYVGFGLLQNAVSQVTESVAKYEELVSTRPELFTDEEVKTLQDANLESARLAITLGSLFGVINIGAKLVNHMIDGWKATAEGFKWLVGLGGKSREELLEDERKAYEDPKVKALLEKKLKDEQDIVERSFHELQVSSAKLLKNRFDQERQIENIDYTEKLAKYAGNHEAILNLEKTHNNNLRKIKADEIAFEKSKREKAENDELKSMREHAKYLIEARKKYAIEQAKDSEERRKKDLENEKRDRQAILDYNKDILTQERELAEQFGVALSAGIGKGAEGLKDSLKKVLIVGINYLEKLALEAFFANTLEGLLTMNPFKVAEGALIVAGLEAVKAGVSSFQTEPGETKTVPGAYNEGMLAVVHGGETIGRPQNFGNIDASTRITIHGSASPQAIQSISDRLEQHRWELEQLFRRNMMNIPRLKGLAPA